MYLSRKHWWTRPATEQPSPAAESLCENRRYIRRAKRREKHRLAVLKFEQTKPGHPPLHSSFKYLSRNPWTRPAAEQPSRHGVYICKDRRYMRRPRRQKETCLRKLVILKDRKPPSSHGIGKFVISETRNRRAAIR